MPDLDCGPESEMAALAVDEEAWARALGGSFLPQRGRDAEGAEIEWQHDCACGALVLATGMVRKGMG